MSLKAPGGTWVLLVFFPSCLIPRTSTPPSVALAPDRYST